MKIKMKTTEELLALREAAILWKEDDAAIQAAEIKHTQLLQALGGRIWEAEPSKVFDGWFYIPGPICAEDGSIVHPLGLTVLPPQIAEVLG